MAQIIEFQGSEDRDWRTWESVLMETYDESNILGGTVLRNCLPKIRSHWEEIFQSVSISGANTEIPSPISEIQIEAIRNAIDRHVKVAIERLKQERLRSLNIIIGLELQLEYYRQNGFPV